MCKFAAEMGKKAHLLVNEVAAVNKTDDAVGVGKSQRVKQ